jgi:hypothetical protein
LVPWAIRATGPLGVRQGASKVRSLVVRAVDNAAARARPRRRVLREGGTQGERSAAGRAPSKRQPAWGSEGRKVDRAPASRGQRDDVPRHLEGGLHREIGGGSGVDRSTGARVESRLQKSARSIFSTVRRFAARRVAGCGVARHGSSSSTRRASSCRAARVPGLQRANVTGTAREAHSVARPRIEPMEGAPVPRSPSFLTRRRCRGAWRCGWSIRCDARSIGPAGERESGPLAQAPAARQWGVRSRSARSGSLSRRAQGVGSRRVVAIERLACCTRRDAVEAVTAKNRDMRGRVSTARTARSSRRKPTPNDDATPRRKRRVRGSQRS